MDLAGYGDLSFNREEYTMAAFAEDINAGIEKGQFGSGMLIRHSMAQSCLLNAAILVDQKTNQSKITFYWLGSKSKSMSENSCLDSELLSRCVTYLTCSSALANGDSLTLHSALN